MPRSHHLPAFQKVVIVAVALALGTASIATAQSTPNPEAATEVRKRFLMDVDTLQSKFMALANAIPADKYAWKPAEGVRTVGEAFMHVAAEYYYWTPVAYGAKPSSEFQPSQEGVKKFEAMSTKAEVLKHLSESFASMKQAVESVPLEKITGEQKLFGGQRTIIETSFIMSGDLHEHLGQLITYARSVGVKPPWSK